MTKRQRMPEQDPQAAPFDGILMQISSIPMTAEQRAEAERNARAICPECGKLIAHRKWILKNGKPVHKSCPVYTVGADGRLHPKSTD